MWQFDTSPSTHTSGSADSNSSRMRAVSSLTFQVRRSGIKLKSDVWLMVLSAEMIHNPHQQTQNPAQQNASHHWKIKTSTPPLIHNIARQAPQPAKSPLPSEAFRFRVMHPWQGGAQSSILTPTVSVTGISRRHCAERMF